MAFQLIPLNQIEDNPYQTRTAYHEDALWTLAHDIRASRPLRPDTCGLLQIPLGRWIEKDDLAFPGAPVQRLKKVQLAFGHRRWRAFLRLRNRYAKESGEDWSVMPIDLADLSDEQMYRLCAAENGQRSDLNPIEKARSIKRGLDDLALTLEQAAGLHGYKDKSSAGNLIRLLELPHEVQQLVEKGDLDARHARELLPLVQVAHAPEEAIKLAKFAIEQDVSASHLAGNVATILSRLTTWVGAEIADFSDWKEGQLPNGCAPTCHTCQFFSRWKHQPYCARKELYLKKHNTWSTRNQNQEALERALHQETRYCRFCHRPQEITGRELDDNDRVTCRHCYRRWPAPNWSTEPPQTPRPPTSDPQPLSIWQLEQKVRHWLDDPDEPIREDDKIEILAAIKTKTGQGPWYFEQIRDSFEETCQDGDLRQACHNVLAQLSSPPLPPARSLTVPGKRAEDDDDEDSWDFTNITTAELEAGLSTLARDGLPLDSPHARRVRQELAERESGSSAPLPLEKVRRGPEYRQTPPGQPTVADLAPIGHYVLSNYNYSSIYKIIGCSEHKDNEGQPTHSLTLAHAHRSPRKNSTPDGWMNDLVAVDGRILKLYQANTNEVWVFPDAESAQAAQTERERIKSRFNHLVWPSRLAALNAWLDEIEQKLRPELAEGFSQENPNKINSPVS